MQNPEEALNAPPLAYFLSMKKMSVLLWLFAASLLVGCATTPPKKLDNLCDIFDEKGSWYKAANKASKRWGVPISVNMAIMHQESRFKARAKPPRTTFLWIFPGPRKSSAYGYAQAKTSTWRWYQKKANRWRADRDNFADAIDFIAWYNAQTVNINNVKPNDGYALYLAYHEGHGGFKRRTFKHKTWLKNVASKVNSRHKRYHTQLKQCERRLQSSGWWPF